MASDMAVFIIPICLIVVLNSLTFLAITLPSNALTSNILMNQSTTSHANKASSLHDSQPSFVNQHGTKRTTNELNVQKNRLKQDLNAFKWLICILINLVINWSIFMSAWPITAICPDCVNATTQQRNWLLDFIFLFCDQRCKIVRVQSKFCEWELNIC